MDADSAWLLAWLGIALAAGIVEVLSLDLIFGMVAGAAIVTAATAGGLGAPVPAQLAVFAGTTLLLLLGVRPPVKRWLLRSAPGTLTGVAALVGRRAQVLSDVTERGGRVKLAGETWSARAHEPGVVLPAEHEVVVIAIEGATAVCAPVGPPTPSTPSALPPGA